MMDAYFDPKNVGKSFAEALELGGYTSISYHIAEVMYYDVQHKKGHRRDGMFWGKAQTAAARIWTELEDAPLTGGQTRKINRLLAKNGFKYAGTKKGPRWIPPAELPFPWKGDDNEGELTGRREDPINMPDEEPVSVKYLCTKCSTQFNTKEGRDSHMGSHTSGVEEIRTQAADRAAKVAAVLSYDQPMSLEQLQVESELPSAEVLYAVSWLRKKGLLSSRKTGFQGKAMYFKAGESPVESPKKKRVHGISDKIFRTLTDEPKSLPELSAELGFTEKQIYDGGMKLRRSGRRVVVEGKGDAIMLSRKNYTPRKASEPKPEGKLPQASLGEIRILIGGEIRVAKKIGPMLDGAPLYEVSS